MKKYIFPVIIALLVGVVIGYATHSSNTLGGAASTSGTVQTTATLVQETIDTSSVATTTGSFAIYNAQGDRGITEFFAYCTGVAKETQNTSWGFTAATSSVSTTTNTAYAGNVNIATTSPIMYVSSTTRVTSGTAVNAANQLWPANTYLVFSFNATDTAVCTTGASFSQL